MLYISDYNKYPDEEKGGVVAIGSFDGVHFGHLEVIKRTTEAAKKNNKKSVVVTFEPHPLLVLKPDLKPFLITSHEQKIELIASLEVDIIVSVNFTSEFSKIKALDFIKGIIVEKIQPSILITGSNFNFGCNSEGNPDLLKKISSEMGFDYTEVPLKSKLGLVFSSTEVRKTIKSSSFEHTKLMLGRYFSIRNRVVEGNKLGNTIGYPTANIELDNFIRPKRGVYAVNVYLPEFDKSFKGIANLGIKPTLEENKEILEVYIFNFTYNIYDKLIEVEFIKFLRSEIKFDNLNQLKSQIHKDCIQAAKYLL